VTRLLVPGGRVVIAHFDWIPVPGKVVVATEEDVSYSHEAWVGRVRASAPVSGTLDEDGVAACSRELTAMLRERFAEDPLVVPHRLWAVTARAPP
jgi:hypothetical protein